MPIISPMDDLDTLSEEQKPLAGNSPRPPLLQHLDSARSSTAEMTGCAYYARLPLHLWEWLTKRVSQPQPDDEPRAGCKYGQSLRLLIEQQGEASHPRNQQQRYAPAEYAGLMLLGFTALAGVGTLVWHRLRPEGTNLDNTPPITTDSPLLPTLERTIDIPRADAIVSKKNPVLLARGRPRILNIKRSKPTTTTTIRPKRCWYFNQATAHEIPGPCAENRVHPKLPPKTTTTTTPQPKRCWYFNEAARIKLPGICPEDRPHPLSHVKKKAAMSQKTTTTAQTSSPHLPTSLAPDLISPVPLYIFKRDGRLSRRHVLDDNTENRTPSSTAAPPDDVKIAPFDYSCIEARNGLNIVDWMRVVGATLESPISNIMREIKIIDAVKTGKGCPTDEEQKEIRAITDPIDKVMTALLTFLPGSQPLAIAQNIIGPLLQLMADDLQGKQHDDTRYADMSSQLLSMAWQFVHSLKPEQRTLLYNEPKNNAQVTEKEKSMLARRFNYRDGQSQIVINNAEYMLQEKPEGTYFIMDTDKQPHFIRYINRQEKWQFIKTAPRVYTGELEKKGKYSMSLGNLPDGYSMQVNKEHDYVILTAPGMPKTTGVFVDESFIPVRLEYIDTELVAFTNTPGQAEKVALKNDYLLGWQFDPPSTKMNLYLRLLLQTQKDSVINNQQYNISPINPLTTISKTSRNEQFIKHNDKYFKVIPNYDKDTHAYTYTVEAFTRAIVKLEDGYLVLKSEENMLFPFNNYRIEDSSDSRVSFRIEKEAVNFLVANAKSYPASATNIVRQGLRTKANGKLVFGVFDAQFQVTKHTGRKIYIQGDRESGRFEDIILWSDLDNYIRVRDAQEPAAKNFKALITCRSIRAPVGGGSCKPVMIEESLDKKLLSYTDETANNDHPSPEALIEHSIIGISNVYKDQHSQKYYFRYNDLYFDAEIIYPHDKNNPTGYTGIKLFSKGDFFNTKTHISDIYMENKGGHIEIKTAETFIAENTNIDEQVVANYIMKRLWIDQPDMDFFENIVTQATNTEFIFVDTKIDTTIPKTTQLPLSEEWLLVKKNLLSSRIADSDDYYITMHTIDSSEGKLTSYEQKASRYIKDSIAYIKDKVIPVALSSLYYDSLYWQAAEDYFSSAIGNGDINFINDIAMVMRKRVNMISDIFHKTFSENKIYLIYARQKESVASSGEHLKSILTADEISQGRIVLTPNNKPGNVFINIDKIDLYENMSPSPNNDLISDLIQVAFQITNQNADFFDIPKINGIQIPVKDAINALSNKLRWGEFPEETLTGLRVASEKYLSNVPGYQYKYENMRFQDPKKLAYLLHNDPGFLAHILTRSPSFLTLMLQDIFHMVSMRDAESFPERIDIRMKKYDTLRGYALYDPDIVNGAMPSRTIAAKEKIYYSVKGIAEFDANVFLHEMSTSPEIDNAIRHPKENCELITTAVADYLKGKKFTNLRYRGIALFLHGGDNMPSNHFAVVGNLHGNDYVFDLTAGQFSSRYAELDGPIILPESEWAQKYANLDGKALITYGDYASRPEARRLFGPDSKYLSWGPHIKIPEARVLRRPSWYFPQTEGATVSKPKYHYEHAKTLRKTARLSLLEPETTENCWDYAVSLLENAELISREPATKLVNGLKRAAANRRYHAPTPGSVEGLFATTQPINNMEELLRVRAGKILIFMQVDPNSPASGLHPTHAMVSIGNGRFAGAKNRKLDNLLSDVERIHTAEQLGYFREGKLLQRKEQSPSALQLIAGSTEELLIDKTLTLRSLAANPHSPLLTHRDIVYKMTGLLRDSGELSAEQSIALRDAMIPMLMAPDDSPTTRHPLQRLLGTYQEIKRNADLHALSKGKLVLFSKPFTSSIEHFMYSLGQGDFVMIDPSKLDPQLNGHNALVKASQFTEDVLSQHKIVAGDISLKNLRQQALLGSGSLYYVEGKTLKVRVQGYDSTLWNLDAFELAEIIKGLGLRNIPPVDWSQIESIVLNSRTASYGPLSTGKILAKIMQKKVTATSLIAKEEVRNNPLVKIRQRNYIPEPLTEDNLEKLRQQSIKLQTFRMRLQKLFVQKPSGRYDRAINTDDLNTVLSNVAALANGQITAAQFFSRHPEYKKKLYAPPQILTDLVAGAVTDELAFVERCMDIIDLSEFTMLLMDNYLQQNT